MRVSGKIIVGKDGSIIVSGNGWNNINLYENSTLDISSAANTVIASGGVRMSYGSTLILRSSNALNKQNSTQNYMYLQLSSSNNSHRLEVLADNKLGGFHFASNSTLVVLLGEQCTQFLLTDLSKNYDTGSWLGKLGDKNASLVFEKFRNDVVKITNFTDVSDADLARVSADGFKDFYITSDGYLNAVAIPEPATCAALLAALAIGFAAYRKR